MKITNKIPTKKRSLGIWQDQLRQLKPKQYLLVTTVNDRNALYSAARSLGIKVKSFTTDNGAFAFEKL